MLKTVNQVPRSRLYTAYGIIIFFILVLIIRFFQIQILRFETFSKKSETNRIRAVSIPAPRGLILDRNGTILVDNYPTFIINVIPGEIEDKNQSFMRVSECTGLDISILMDNYNKYYRSRFVPVRLAKDLTLEQISVLEEHKLDLAGVHYSHFQERVFPSRIRGSHFLGYVKEITRDIYDKLENQPRYELGDLIGWQGLEKIYEQDLQGSKGVQYQEVNAYGQVMGMVGEKMGEPAQPGTNLILSIDAGLQEILETTMTDKQGTVIISDAKSGGILAYVSAPDFPPDLFTGITPADEWNRILTDASRPLLDRNSSGLYPPGSTFKMITLLALAEQQKLDHSFETTCNGSYEFGDRVFRCWNEAGHGSVDLRKSLAESCNIYYYQIVQNLDIDEWSTIAKSMGFGRRVGIDIPTEQRGNIPSRKYMNSRYGRYGWSRGALLNLALGQGDIAVTPIQVAQYINLIATNGQTNKLHFRADRIEPLAKKPVFSDNSWNLIHELMEAVVYDPGGTGKSANPNIPGVVVKGKTGTAQNPHGEDHGWFVGIADDGTNTLTATILIEHGGHGGQVAAPIARKAFDYLFRSQNMAEIP